MHKVDERGVRAHLGTTAHVCNVLVRKCVANRSTAARTERIEMVCSDFSGKRFPLVLELTEVQLLLRDVQPSTFVSVGSKSNSKGLEWVWGVPHRFISKRGFYGPASVALNSFGTRPVGVETSCRNFDQY